MKLFTKAQHAKLTANGLKQAIVKGTDQEHDFFPVVKLFDPCGGSTWLVTEIDPEDHSIGFGLCDLGMGEPEIGSFSITELEDYSGLLGLGIERDLHFTATKRLSTYAKEARAKGRIEA